MRHWGSPASQILMVRPSLSSAYIARIMPHYTVPLSQKLQEATMNPLSLSPALPKRRGILPWQNEHGRFLRHQQRGRAAMPDS